MTIEFLDRALLHIQQKASFSKSIVPVPGFTKEENELLVRACYKFEKDGYVYSKEFVLTDDGKHRRVRFYISFDGMMFIQQGGYAEQQRKDQYKKWLEDKLMKTTIDSNVSGHSANRLFWITLIVAVAGVIAPWLEFANNKEIDTLKEQIKALQVEQQQKQPQLFYSPAK